MRFTLVYEGELSASESRRYRAQEMRRVFHAQLAALWRERPYLARWLDNYRRDPDTNESLGEFGSQALVLTDRTHGVIAPVKVNAFTFIPLATRQFQLECDLDILFLRGEHRGRFFPHETGDLDNRLKTLFDALTVPQSGQLPEGDHPGADENPFFCLLGDDKLITAFRIESERLLRPNPIPNTVQLLIRVNVKTRHVTRDTVELQGD